MQLVTFLSDYGVRDTYVGQVKGAMAAIAQDLNVVDLAHDVPPQDVRAGAFLLWTAVKSFPPGSIHLAVVDPGVGTRRRAVAVKTGRGDILVGPDNGLLPMATLQLGGTQSVVELSNTAFHRETGATTFHGRDLFGPVAAHLAKGAALEQLGSTVGDLGNPFPWPEPHHEGDGQVIGAVLHVDSYGNLITSLAPDQLPQRFALHVGRHWIRGGLADTYQSVAIGKLLCLIGSSGLLEVAVRDGNAAQMLKLKRDSPILVKPLK